MSIKTKIWILQGWLKGFSKDLLETEILSKRSRGAIKN